MACATRSTRISDVSFPRRIGLQDLKEQQTGEFYWLSSTFAFSGGGREEREREYRFHPCVSRTQAKDVPHACFAWSLVLASRSQLKKRRPRSFDVHFWAKRWGEHTGESGLFPRGPKRLNVQIEQPPCSTDENSADESLSVHHALVGLKRVGPGLMPHPQLNRWSGRVSAGGCWVSAPEITAGMKRQILRIPFSFSLIST